jgi:hypothetical protein
VADQKEGFCATTSFPEAPIPFRRMLLTILRFPAAASAVGKSDSFLEKVRFQSG